MFSDIKSSELVEQRGRLITIDRSKHDIQWSGLCAHYPSNRRKGNMAAYNKGFLIAYQSVYELIVIVVSENNYKHFVRQFLCELFYVSFFYLSKLLFILFSFSLFCANLLGERFESSTDHREFFRYVI